MINVDKEKKEHHLHDENFKTLLSTWVKQFTKLFYDKFYNTLDDVKPWIAISEAVASDYKFFTKDLGNYFVDRAFLVSSKDGQKQYVLHFEFQSTDDDMDFRARHYNNLLAVMFPDHVVITIVVGFHKFPKYKVSSTKHSLSMKKLGLNSSKTFDYDLINLRSGGFRWNDSRFLNEDEPNPVAIALWGLIEDNKSIKENGVEMMLKGYELLSEIQKKATSPEDFMRPLKFLADYILAKMNDKQKKELNQGIEKLKKSSKGEQVMTLLAAVQSLEKGLKVKRSATKVVEGFIINKLKENESQYVAEIKNLLDNTYDEDIIVQAFKLLEQDPKGFSSLNLLKKVQ